MAKKIYRKVNNSFIEIPSKVRGLRYADSAINGEAAFIEFSTTESTARDIEEAVFYITPPINEPIPVGNRIATLELSQFYGIDFIQSNNITRVSIKRKGRIIFNTPDFYLDKTPNLKEVVISTPKLIAGDGITLSRVARQTKISAQQFYLEVATSQFINNQPKTEITFLKTTKKARLVFNRAHFYMRPPRPLANENTIAINLDSEPIRKVVKKFNAPMVEWIVPHTLDSRGSPYNITNPPGQYVFSLYDANGEYFTPSQAIVNQANQTTFYLAVPTKGMAVLIG